MLTTNSEGRDASVRTERNTVRVRVSGVRPAEVRLPVGGLLLEGLLGGGVSFAYACQAGLCGECRCRLISGEVEELPCSPGALEARDRARGIILACRARVLSDLVIQAITGSESVDCRDGAPLAGASRALRGEVAGG